MMDHYVDIRLRSDPEFPATLLMSALFTKLHRALAQLQTQHIGVSFPQHRKHLGECLRLHGSQSALSQLQSQPWLQGMHDHVDSTPVQPVPAVAQHRCVQRVQAKSSPDRIQRRLVKRLMQRENLSQEQAQTRVQTGPARELDLPYLTIQSASTGQKFRLFISHGPLNPNPANGLFNSYGLSPTATVPWF